MNEAQRQQELPAAPVTTIQSGFDIIVGNPPFVTARSPKKRELYRERWPRVCYKGYQLVCPFFEMSFGLLRLGGQLGFIVSNAFAVREFGKPLVEEFFSTVDLRKVIDCSGLLFPGHGTPTCLVFGGNQKPSPKIPIRVAAILPGGGDLRTPPEESPLWHTLAEHHDQAGFADSRVTISDRTRSQVTKWPWRFDPGNEPTQKSVEGNSPVRLSSFVDEPVGHVAITRTDDVFIVPPHMARRLELEASQLKVIGMGETMRNWSSLEYPLIVFPYKSDLQPIDPHKNPRCINYLKPFRYVLENVVMHGSVKKKETNVTWFEYSRLARPKFRVKRSIVLPEIATHNHALVDEGSAIFHQTAPVIKLSPSATTADHYLLAGLLNSSAALFWLKQVCFNKAPGADEERDRYVYAGNKVEQFPMPAPVVESLRGKGNPAAERLTVLAQACWERGRQLPSLALKKIFERDGEAYYAWNTSLPGYVAPHLQLATPFQSTTGLQQNFHGAVELRERIRAEMIGLQEEMDWLVYATYGLLPLDSPAVGAVDTGSDPPPLQREQRPFCLWAEAGRDYDKAVTLIPKDWPTERKALWAARLAVIQDNEHIRRIEQPVCKRRWDEQWKVGNRWTCGPVAYAAEFVDAFNWWLAEKAEWYLEHKGKDGPIDLETWTSALWKDERVQAAWPVVVDALAEIGAHKAGSTVQPKSKIENSAAAFARYFRDLVNDETVPDGIPPAVAWDQLEKKRKIPAKVKSIRGKLNVPRERFHLTSDGLYLWAGKE